MYWDFLIFTSAMRELTQFWRCSWLCRQSFNHRPFKISITCMMEASCWSGTVNSDMLPMLVAAMSLGSPFVFRSHLDVHVKPIGSMFSIPANKSWRTSDSVPAEVGNHSDTENVRLFSLFSMWLKFNIFENFGKLGQPIRLGRSHKPGARSGNML